MKPHLPQCFMCAFALLILLFFTGSLAGQGVYVTIRNTTVSDIDLLVIGGKYLGRLEKDSAKGPFIFDKFRFDSGYPYESLWGIVDRTRLRSKGKWRMCATGQHSVSKGELAFTLSLAQKEE